MCASRHLSHLKGFSVKPFGNNSLLKWGSCSTSSPSTSFSSRIVNAPSIVLNSPFCELNTPPSFPASIHKESPTAGPYFVGFKTSSSPPFHGVNCRSISYNALSTVICQKNQRSAIGMSFTVSGALSSVSVRGIATQPLNVHLPPPPPREFEADGSPKKYRLNHKAYDHDYDWERWSLVPAGVFHTVYMGEFAKDLPPLWAWVLNFPILIAVLPVGTAIYIASFLISNFSTIDTTLEILNVESATWALLHSVAGIHPKRYTVEWIEASKERDRAENSNPFTRYLDRRRKERGPHWLAEDYFPDHPHLPFIDTYYHDTALLRERAEKAAQADGADDAMEEEEDSE